MAESKQQLHISTPIEDALPGDTITMSAGPYTAEITAGVWHKAATWARQKANAVWSRLTPQNFLFFVLARFNEDRVEAVHDACAYFLSTFGGVPSHILTNKDCEDVFKSLSSDLKAEIEANEARLQKQPLDPASVEAKEVYDSMGAWDPAADAEEASNDSSVDSDDTSLYF